MWARGDRRDWVDTDADGYGGLVRNVLPHHSRKVVVQKLLREIASGCTNVSLGP
jgi:hypothetical protein